MLISPSPPPPRASPLARSPPRHLAGRVDASTKTTASKIKGAAYSANSTITASGSLSAPRSARGQRGHGHLSGIFADAVAVAPHLEGCVAIDWLVEQPLHKSAI
jgi:hypothetical protein